MHFMWFYRGIFYHNDFPNEDAKDCLKWAYFVVRSLCTHVLPLPPTWVHIEEPWVRADLGPYHKGNLNKVR